MYNIQIKRISQNEKGTDIKPIRLADFKFESKNLLLKKLFNFTDLDIKNLKRHEKLKIKYHEKKLNHDNLNYFIENKLNDLEIQIITTFKNKDFFKTKQDLKRSFVRVDIVFYEPNRINKNLNLTSYVNFESNNIYIEYKKNMKRYTSHINLKYFNLYEILKNEKRLYKSVKLFSHPYIKRSGNQKGYVQEYYKVKNNKLIFLDFFYSILKLIENDINKLRFKKEIHYGKNPVDLNLPLTQIKTREIKEGTFQNRYKKQMFDNGLLK